MFLTVPFFPFKSKKMKTLHMNAEKVVDTEAEDERNGSP